MIVHMQLGDFIVVRHIDEPTKAYDRDVLSIERQADGRYRVNAVDEAGGILLEINEGGWDAWVNRRGRLTKIDRRA